MARTPWKMYLSAWNFPDRCSSEFCEMAKTLTLILKLNSRLKLKNFFSLVQTYVKPNLREFFNLNHVSI